MIPSLLHVVQGVLSAYSLQQSSISIPNLQKYESASKKAAKYSKTADNELQMTRKTQATGVFAAALSALSALLLAFHIISPGFKGFLLNVAVALVSAASSLYIGGHWDGKGQIPLVQNYNEALGSTREVRGQLALLGLVWGLSSFVELWNLLFSR